MKFEVYCDEAFPDLFTSDKPQAQYLMIGSLWMPSEIRNEVKAKIKALREKHQVWGEIKWTKISPSKVDFFTDLVELFISYGDTMRFRCIAVDRGHVDFGRHNSDRELGFYKFYYQVLHHWILGFNTYSIFCDLKSNRERTRFQELKRVLSNANLSADVECVQALPSKEVVMLQLTDFLLGAASSRINKTLKEGTAKEKVVKTLEERLGIPQLCPTYQSEHKFNIFKINLQGGW